MASTLYAGQGLGQDTAPAKRPNILWITCEDTSPHLGCFGCAEARTPNLDRLAAEGARYTNAFSVSGVCAPSRSCLITGMYPITLATCHMRCSHVPPPPVRCFPAYLRDAGYYCTNNVKTDYQFPVPEDAWDECSKKAHWRNRRDPDQPFFSVFNFTVTHESQIGERDEQSDRFQKELPPSEWHDPDKATPPPYYPNTPEMRKYWAHYFDLVTLMDRQAGEILDQLAEDGLADNTLVFFYGDHGVGLPRAKRWMYDSGLQVPLILRWPGHIAPGTATDRLVSFLDFAPTILSAANVPIPKHMQGAAFLGEQEGKPHDYICGARDRMDERYDIIRAVRDKRFKYIRNYEPYRPYDQYLTYCEGWAVMKEMRRVEAAGQLNDAQKLFFRDVKPLEEFYDTSSDPHEVNSLVDDPKFAEDLARLRKHMDNWLETARDLGFVPEIELDDWLASGGKSRPAPGKTCAAPDGTAATTVFGRSVSDWVAQLNGADTLTRLRAIKTLGLLGPDMAPLLVNALQDGDSAVAFWATVSLGYAPPASPGAIEALAKALDRPEISAKLAAAGALCRLGKTDLGLPVALDAMKHENPFARLFAVEILEQVGPKDPAVKEALEIATKDDNDYVTRIAKHALA